MAFGSLTASFEESIGRGSGSDLQAGTPRYFFGRALSHCYGQFGARSVGKTSRTAARLLAVFALVFAIVPIAGWVIETSGSAQAQSAPPNPIEDARKKIESLIAKLRGRTMPEGIIKSNGKLEATEVDVAAKYPGRLATLNVDEGDEVKAGQVVGTISSPETEAQLRAAQAQLLKAKQSLAEAVANIAQRQSDLTFTRADYERGKALLPNGSISQQLVDKRRNSFESAEAAYVAANAQRDEAESRSGQPKLMSNGCNQFWLTWCWSRRGADACNTG